MSRKQKRFLDSSIARISTTKRRADPTRVACNLLKAHFLLNMVVNIGYNLIFVFTARSTGGIYIPHTYVHMHMHMHKKKILAQDHRAKKNSCTYSGLEKTFWQDVL